MGFLGLAMMAGRLATGQRMEVRYGRGGVSAAKKQGEKTALWEHANIFTFECMHYMYIAETTDKQDKILVNIFINFCFYFPYLFLALSLCKMTSFYAGDNW